MASLETYDGTALTSVNAVVATTASLDQSSQALSSGDDDNGGGPTAGGTRGVIISGHEDRFVRFFDANSGKWYAAWSRPFADTHRSMHLQHARSPGRHLIPVPQPRRARARQRRPRRVATILVARKAILHAGDHEPSRHARRGRVLGRLEPGRQVDRERGRRRCRQGVCTVVVVMDGRATGNGRRTRHDRRHGKVKPCVVAVCGSAALACWFGLPESCSRALSIIHFYICVMCT